MWHVQHLPLQQQAGLPLRPETIGHAQIVRWHESDGIRLVVGNPLLPKRHYAVMLRNFAQLGLIHLFRHPKRHADGRRFMHYMSGDALLVPLHGHVAPTAQHRARCIIREHVDAIHVRLPFAHAVPHARTAGLLAHLRDGNCAHIRILRRCMVPALKPIQRIARNSPRNRRLLGRRRLGLLCPRPTHACASSKRQQTRCGFLQRSFGPANPTAIKAQVAKNDCVQGYSSCPVSKASCSSGFSPNCECASISASA